jgi:hypothetical protein
MWLGQPCSKCVRVPGQPLFCCRPGTRTRSTLARRQHGAARRAPSIESIERRRWSCVVTSRRTRAECPAIHLSASSCSAGKSPAVLDRHAARGRRPAVAVSIDEANNVDGRGESAICGEAENFAGTESNDVKCCHITSYQDQAKAEEVNSDLRDLDHNTVWHSPVLDLQFPLLTLDYSTEHKGAIQQNRNDKRDWIEREKENRNRYKEMSRTNSLHGFRKMFWIPGFIGAGAHNTCLARFAI